MGELVSVIIPIYNVQPYLSRCIDSVVNQTYKNIEIILINDGSTDDSEVICKQYKERYNNILYFKKENGGLGPARNTGLDYSNGEFIVFIDSDDWIAPDMVEKLLTHAIDKSYEIVSCDFYKVEGLKITNHKAFPLGYKNTSQRLNQLAPASAWNKIYRKEVFNRFRFWDERSLYEDMPVTIPLISWNDNIGHIDEPLYFYFQRDDSIMKKNATLRQLDIIKAFRLMLQRSKPCYLKEVANSVAIRISNSADGLNKYIKADMIEFLQNELMNYLINFDSLPNKNDTIKLNKFLKMRIIPKIIYTDGFYDKSQYSEELEAISFNNKEQFIGDAEYIELNHENCDLKNAPSVVKKEYEKNNMDFVWDYFKIKKLHETGGIALNKNVEFTCPLGRLRADDGFIGYNSMDRISTHIVGAIAENELLSEVLQTYEDERYNELDISLYERINEMLQLKYNVVLNGRERYVNSFKVYSAEVLYLDLNKNNMAKVRNDLVNEREMTSRVDIEEDTLIYLLNDYNNKPKNLNSKNVTSPGRNGQLEEEIKTIIANYENSTCWKITKPIRIIKSLLIKRRK